MTRALRLCRAALPAGLRVYMLSPPRHGHQFSRSDKNQRAWVVSDRRGLRVPGKPCCHVRHDSYLAYNAIKKLSIVRIFS